jgi:hypothetical protein
MQKYLKNNFNASQWIEVFDELPRSWKMWQNVLSLFV